MKKTMVIVALVAGFFMAEVSFSVNATAKYLPPAKQQVILKEKEKIRQDKQKKKRIKKQMKEGKITKAQAKTRVNNINRHIDVHKGNIRSAKHSAK